ncbi:phosphoglycerate kinase [Oceanidesulfovibrio marinus]|uniref:Phosphoglycerate kinase n=1 Tax=Oceanidesulfovibrio marinus TaxID=370038 RepID=A0A6P1ZLI5_9BACT|nr:phosphoglycerate kinase [Oceanidesulfovibrio marinus]TVM35964.1 phosphoglycerate kinase [Oceanidesulfovibrio marinus]
MAVLTMNDVELKGKRVLIREDLNVPLKNGVVQDDTRIRGALPSIKAALDAGARVIVVSHLGRPKEGEFDEQFSLKPVAAALQKALDVPVELVRDWEGGVDAEPGKVVLLENIRFAKGEKANDDELGKKIAALCDVFVFDAFGAAHRAQASTHAAMKFAPVAVAGLLMQKELESLGKAIKDPKRPLVAIVGGAKVSTKLGVLKNLVGKVDVLIVGGGIANTFLAATGKPVGKSLYEPDLIDDAKAILKMAKDKGVEMPLPEDVIVAPELSENATPHLQTVEKVNDQDMILDIGPQTAKAFAALIHSAKTVLWNGPVGAFEYDQFAGGTKVLGNAIKDSDAFSVVGGGDVVSAIERFGLADGVSYISTGGGSFLEFVEGKELPVVKLLEERSSK